MTDTTPAAIEEQHSAIVGWLRNPWSNCDNQPRGPIPEWCGALMFEAANIIDALAAERDAAMRERDEARNELRFYELFSDHASVVRGVIAAAGDLPTLNDGPFKEGFFSGIEEVAARADIQANDGNRQMQDLMSQIADLVQGNATLIMAPAGEYVNAIDRAEKAETEAAAMLDGVPRYTYLSDYGHLELFMKESDVLAALTSKGGEG